MHTIPGALDAVLAKQGSSDKPLAVVLAGHNGSGKSTLWYGRLASRLQIPLVNADRLMMSILPQVGPRQHLPAWASKLRDEDTSWMRVAQSGVQAFVSHAMANKVPFAMETVFSHWDEHPDGTVESKIDLIREMQDAGYFVLLVFVGLASSNLSIARVQTRVAEGGHDVPVTKLRSRFPRTQKAIGEASLVADSTLMVDNSRKPDQAFTLCRVQLKAEVIYDRRHRTTAMPAEISAWMDLVCPEGK